MRQLKILIIFLRENKEDNRPAGEKVQRTNLKVSKRGTDWKHLGREHEDQVFLGGEHRGRKHRETQKH